jgi:WD40 repeat protein
VSPVGELRGIVTDPAPLGFADQAAVLVRIKGLLASPETAEDARDLLEVLRTRHDLFAEVEHEISADLLATPNGGSTSAPCKSRFVGRLLGHTGIVRTAAFNHDGRKVVTASDDGTARVWNALTGQEVIALPHPGQRVLQASYSPEGLTVLTVCTDGVIRGWDPRTGEVDFKLDPPGETLYQRATYNPDGNLIVFVRQIGPNKTFAGIHAPMQLNHSFSGIELDSTVRDARYSPNGNTVAVALASGVAQTWTWSTIGSSWRLMREFRGHKGQVCSANFSPDGARVITASYDGTARVWDAATSTELMQLGGHTGVVWKAIYSPDGGWIVTAGEDSTMRVWDAATGEPLRVLDGHDDAVYTVNFAPGGCVLVTASADKTARVWDLSDLAEEAQEGQ